MFSWLGVQVALTLGVAKEEEVMVAAMAEEVCVRVAWGSSGAHLASSN